jgi:wobble nucleotide-excising tRNase
VGRCSAGHNGRPGKGREKMNEPSKEELILSCIDELKTMLDMMNLKIVNTVNLIDDIEKKLTEIKNEYDLH